MIKNVDKEPNKRVKGASRGKMMFIGSKNILARYKLNVLNFVHQSF